jgi:hypothetical protein
VEVFMSKHTVAVLGVLACASVAACAKESPAEDTAAARAKLEKAALASLQKPGMEIRTIPSTWAGVATWTVHLGEGLTVIGKTDKDEVRVAIGWREDAAKKLAVAACVVAKDGDCNGAARAIAKDLGPTAPASSVVTQTLRPATEPGGDACVAGVAADARTLGFAPDSVICQEGNVLINGRDMENPCAYLDNRDAPSEMPDRAGTAAACCQGQTGEFWIEDPGRLINNVPIPLLCSTSALNEDPL